MKRKFWIPALIVVVAVAGLTWWLMQRRGADRELVLYGNIDLRQVQLAFNNSERIAAVLVQEGDHVSRAKCWRDWIPAVWSRRWLRLRRKPRRSASCDPAAQRQPP